MKWLARWWWRWQRVPSFEVTPAPTILTPKAEAREAVNDVDGQHQRAQMYLTRNAMDRLCAQANAYVVREHAPGEVDVLRDAHAPLLTPYEGTLLEKIDVIVR